MAMKEAEKKLKSHDKDISGLKKMVFVMCQNIDQLIGEMREVTLARGKEESLVTEGSRGRGRLQKQTRKSQLR